MSQADEEGAAVDNPSPLPSTTPSVFVNNFYLQYDPSSNVWRLLLAEAGPGGNYGRGSFVIPDEVMKLIVEGEANIRKHHEAVVKEQASLDLKKKH